MIEVERVGAAEGAEFYFVSVAGVEKRDGSALVEPLLELAGSEPGRGTTGGIDAGDTEGDDFFFDLHQHAIERLMIAFT